MSTNVKPSAFAACGEHAEEWARLQLAKFMPSGANYRRLRAMQTAGAMLEKDPDLYANALNLLDLLETMTRAAVVQVGPLNAYTISGETMQQARALVATITDPETYVSRQRAKEGNA